MYLASDSNSTRKRVKVAPVLKIVARVEGLTLAPISSEWEIGMEE